jgi:hypothetical protein
MKGVERRQARAYWKRQGLTRAEWTLARRIAAQMLRVRRSWNRTRGDRGTKRVKVRSPDRLLDDLEIPVPRQTKILGVANLMILEKHGPSYQQRPGDKSQKAEAA